MVLLEAVPMICFGTSIVSLYVAFNMFTLAHKISNSNVYFIVYTLGILLSLLNLAFYSAIFAGCLCAYTIAELVMTYFLKNTEDQISKMEQSPKFF